MVALATLTLVSPAQAADPPSAGDPDYSFGNGGKLTMSFTNAVGVYDDYANAIAVYPDGRFVVAGAAKGNPLVDNTYQFGVVRFNADGTRDSSFGTDGVVLTNNGLFHDRATAVVIQPDGKIVVSGYCFGDDFFTIRLNQNGSLDSSFGSGGKVTTDFSGQNDQAHGVHLQGDDKIVVTGWAATGPDNAGKQYAAVRYLANGSIDTSYGTNGKVLVPMGTSGDGNGSTIQPDGKVVIAGRTLNSPGVYGVGLVRLTTSGSLDSGFGAGGRVLTSFGPKDETLTAVAMQPDGRIVATGNAQWGSYFDTTALRLLPNGSLDGSFGSGGMLRANVSPDNDTGHALLVRPDGRIVIAGSYYGDGNDMYVARFWPSGARDIEFGRNGVTRMEMSKKYDEAFGVASQGTKLIAVGRSFNGKDNDWALIRVHDGPGLAGARRYPVSFARPGKRIKATRLQALVGNANTTSLSRVDVAFLKVNKKLLRKRKKCDWVTAGGRSVRLSAARVNGKLVCADAYWNQVVGTDSWNIRLRNFKPGTYRIKARAMTPFGQLGLESTRKLRVTRG